jgi:hypothetical protein
MRGYIEGCMEGGGGLRHRGFGEGGGEMRSYIEGCMEGGGGDMWGVIWKVTWRGRLYLTAMASDPMETYAHRQPPPTLATTSHH